MTTAWNQRRQSGSILYFLDNTSTRLRRFDFSTGTWLSDITLSAAAQAFDVDATGIYVKTALGVKHLTLDGASSVTVPSATGVSPFIEVSGNYLLLGDQSYTYSYNKQTGALVSSRYTYYSMGGTSAIESEGRFYGVTTGVSPADILVVEYNPTTGVITGSFDSPYHGTYPAANKTYAREAGGLVVASSGTVYKSNTLEYLGSLGGSIQGAAFLSDRFVVMRGGRLAVFSNDVHELGQLSAPTGLQDIVAYSGTLYSIAGAIDSLMIQALDLAPTAAPTPPPARSWAEAAPNADFILGDGENVILASKVEHAAYTFNSQSWAHTDVTPLYLSPSYVGFSAVNNTVYASYDGGAIHAFPRTNPGTAHWLAATPYSASGLATAGEYIFAADLSGAWATHYTFSPSGNLLSNPEWNYVSRQYEWDPLTRRMYFFRDGMSPNDLHVEQIAVDGSITAEGESPYHGEVDAKIPIRVAPDGGRIILGSGQVFESGGLTIVGNLNSNVLDIGWLNGDTYAISNTAPPQLRRYNTAYQIVQSGRVRGTPRRILPISGGFVYIANVGNSTIIGRLDSFFAKADLAVDPVTVGTLFSGGSQINLAVSVGNNGTVPSNGATVNADLSGLENSGWNCIPGPFVAGCTATLRTGSIADVIDLADGGQAVYQINGTIPATARNELRIPVSISPVSNSSDPELRNNMQEIVLRLDRIFDHGFE